MRDRVCPIEECAATVRFEQAVVEVTPRYRLHDLGEVDEFAACPECDSAVAGFYPEDGDGEGEVELILDIDDDDGSEGEAAATGSADGADGEAGIDGDDGFDVPADDFDDPDNVLDEAADDGDEEGHESVFGATDDE